MKGKMKMKSKINQTETSPTEFVDLIASGYEWTCPGEGCGFLNHEVEATEFVTCSNCKTNYTTNPPDHAQG